MKSGIVALVLDGIGVFVCVFIIALCLLDLIFPLNISFILALCFAVIGCIWQVKIKKSNQKKSNLKKSQRELFSSTMLAFNLYPDEKRFSIIKNVLESEGQTVKITHRGVFSLTDNTLWVIKFGFVKVNKADIVKTFNYLKTQQNAVIVSETFDEQIVEFVKMFNKRITLVDGEKLFERLNNAKLLPLKIQNQLQNNKNKPRAFSGLKNKKSVKGFFWGGLYFLAMSFFVPIKTYYVLWGGVLIIISVILKLFVKPTVND
jgi:predicted transcriptional regulator with HTH domain